MKAYAEARLWLVPLILLLMTATGCSNTNLGNIDESADNRQEMPGPGIFADESGETKLKWSSDSSDPAAEQSASTSSTTMTAAVDTTATADKAEFEQFKAWNELRTEGANSAEYREFQQWLEYRKFKAAE